MDPILIDPVFFALLCGGVAFLYASVGLGGGSSYTALLALFGASAAAIPTVSLLLNVMVTSIGAVLFTWQGHTRVRLLFPFLVPSVPAAYLGGSVHLPSEVFYWILLVALIGVALRIYLWNQVRISRTFTRLQTLSIALVGGALLGLLAGAVGIGGGIFLVPLILVLGLGSEREAAACGSVFVWVNSVAGLGARLQHHPIEWMAVAPIVGAVAVGGLVGAYLGSSRFSPRQLQQLLGVVILIAIAFLFQRILVPV